MDKPPPYSPPQAGFVTQQPGVSPYPGYPPQQGYPPQSGYPPQPGYPTQPPPEIHLHPPAENTIIVTNAPTIVTALGPHAQVVTCPHCHHSISTRVETEPSTKTHLFALLLCLFGCWPCCCLPYCMDSCQSRNHYCIHCGAFLGSYDD